MTTKAKIIFRDSAPIGGRIARMAWTSFYYSLFFPTPNILFGWRRFLLRLFGAKIGSQVHVYPSARIWAPWNLTMKEGSSLAPGVDCYCVDKIEIGAWAVVSQRAFLCTAGHDIRSKTFDLKTAPITIGANAWVAAEAFVGPGVSIAKGAVVGAKACVTKDVRPWAVVTGNPARIVGKRTIRKVPR